MNERKATKRALLTSITALVMCVVMLVGTTFAWFTDTAKTNVNKIQAGNLKVDIVDASGNSLESETLKWVKAQGGAGQAILWEPGATYELQPFYVKNEGNLAIKYEIKITGTQGDAKLLEAIDFYVNDATDALTSDSIGTGTLMPKDKPDSTSSAITIKGHMKESAKNEYQGLSLDGIAITVYATQAIYEYDSSSNTYDNGAFDALDDLYPVSKSVAIKKDANGNKQQAVINDADNSGKKTYEVTVPGAAMADDADNISVTVSKAASVDTANFSVVTTGNKLEQFDVTVSGIKSGNDKQITVELFIGKGYTTLTGNVPVKHLMKDGHVENLTGTYNPSTGCVTFKTTSFSPFAVEVPDMAAAIGAGHELTYYYTLPDAVAAAKNGDTITLVRDVALDKSLIIGSVDSEQKVLTLDLNGHSISAAKAVIGVQNAKLTVTGPGKIYETSPYSGAIYIKGSDIAANEDYTVVNIGAGVELEAWSPIFVTPYNGSGYGVVVNVDGAKLTGKTDTDGGSGCAIYVNGSIQHQNNAPKLVLNNVTQTATGAGMYLAGYANTTITGGSITGGNTGIEIRAGELTLNDCALEATAQEFSCEPNGSGTTTVGAAIAIAQHTTKKDIAVTINGGSFKGVKALNESNPQANDPAPQVKLSIDGGTFIGDISTADVTGFIKSGTFSSQPDNKYIAEGCTATESEGVWTVARKSQSN